MPKSPRLIEAAGFYVGYPQWSPGSASKNWGSIDQDLCHSRRRINVIRLAIAFQIYRTDLEPVNAVGWRSEGKVTFVGWANGCFQEGFAFVRRHVKFQFTNFSSLIFGDGKGD